MMNKVIITEDILSPLSNQLTYSFSPIKTLNIPTNTTILLNTSVNDSRPDAFIIWLSCSSPFLIKYLAKNSLITTTNITTINVINNSSSKVETTSTTNSNGMEEIQMMITDTVSAGLSNGTFDKPMKASYNMSRPGVR